MCSGPWDRRSQRRRLLWCWRGLTGGDVTKREPGAATTSVNWLAPDLTATVKLKDVVPELILARHLSKNAGQYTPDNFDHETQANIRDLLAFRANADWFRM